MTLWSSVQFKPLDRIISSGILRKNTTVVSNMSDNALREQNCSELKYALDFPANCNLHCVIISVTIFFTVTGKTKHS